MITDKERNRVSNISRLSVRALLFNHFLQKGIQTEDDLYGYIKEFLGFIIPKEDVCTHHVAPWRALTDIFFEKKHSTFLFGSRSSGKTRMLSILNNCVTGDTLIQCPRDYKKYPNGIPIKDLVGKEFWVYSYDTNEQKLVLKWATNVGLRRTKVPVYKVTYEWRGYKGQLYSDSVRATDDHEFLMFSGKYKAVKDLKRGDSLLPFSESRDSDGYVRVGTAGVKSQAVHLFMEKASRFIWEGVTGISLPKGTHVHHKDANELNNEFDNLLPLTNSKHQFFHWKILKTQPSLDKVKKRDMTARMVGVDPLWFDKDWLIDQYVVQEKSGLEIAKEFGTTATTIKNWRDRHGIPCRSVASQTRLSQQVSLNNHKVTSVKYAGLEDVYCMEVEGTHNFMTSHICIKNCEATFKPKIQICNAGAIITQAQRNYEYTLSYYEDDLLASTLKNSIQSHTELTNGSVVSVISGSMRGFNGAHPCKLRLDEIELIDWYAIQEAFSMSQSTDKWMAQDTLSSTRKFSFGSVQRLLDEAKDRDITVYPWCIWESLETCTRLCKGDPVYGDCPIYSRIDVKTGKEVMMCGGKAHKCSGWYPINDLIKKIRLLDINTWKAQWLCERTGDSSTVYGEFFNPDVHVLKTNQDFLNKFYELEGEPLSPRHFRISGIDFGGQFAFVRAVKSPTYKRRFYIMEVYFSKKDVVLDTHVDFIKKMQWWGKGKELIYGDSAARQDIIEFNNKGIPVRPALKDVFSGLNIVKSLLEIQDDGRPGIYINGPMCEPLITEFGSYSYKIRKDGLPDLDSLFKDRDHCLDALRYLLYNWLRGGSRVRAKKRTGF